MNHIACFQPISFCDFCLSRLAAVERPTLLLQFRPCRPVNCSVYTASAQQAAVGGIHNSLHIHLCDVALFICDLMYRHLTISLQHDMNHLLCHAEALAPWIDNDTGFNLHALTTF